MADHGKVYPTYTPELCDAMAELACGADILTPNLTEAAIILGEPIGDAWCGTDIGDDEARRMIDALVAKGAKHVVLKASSAPASRASATSWAAPTWTWWK